MADYTLSAKVTADGGAAEKTFTTLQQKLEDLERKFRGFGSKADDSLEKLCVKLEAMGERFQDVGQKVQSTGQSMQRTGTVMTAAITTPFILGGKAALTYEDKMASINTLLSDTTNLEAYGDAALEASNRTGIGMSIMQDGMYQTISAIGDGGKETVKIFDLMATSAKAGGAEVSDAVSLITSGMKGYGSVNEETAQKISDLAFETAKLGVTTFPEMSRSMQPLFPLSEALSVSYEELFGVMATLTGVTGNTSEVSTQLKQVFSGLMSPTSAMSKLIEEYGYANGSAMIEGEGFAGMLSIVKEETGGQVDKMAELFGSTEALTAATALSGAQFDVYGEKLSQLQNASGATQTAYDKMETKGSSLRESWNQLINTLTELSTKMLTALEPVIRAISEKVQALSDWFSGLSEEQKQVAATISIIAAVAGPMLLIFGTIMSVVGGIITKFGAFFGVISKVGTAIANFGGITKVLGAAFAAITSPIGIAIAAIAAVIAVVVLLWNNCEWFRDGVIAAWEAIKTFFAGLPAFFSSLWEAISAWATIAWTSISTAASTAWQFIVSVFSGVSEFFMGIWNTVSQWAVVAWQAICNTVTLAWQAICAFFTPAVEFFAQIWNAVASVAELAWGIIVTCVRVAIALITAIFQLIQITMTAVWDAIVVVVQIVWGAITAYIEHAIAALIVVFQGIQTAMTAVWNAICTAASAAWNAICSIVSVAIGAIVSVATPIVGIFGNIFSAIWDIVSNVFTTIGSFIASVFAGIQNAWNGLKSFVGGVFDGIFSAVQSLVDAVKGFVNKVIGGINGAIGLINMIPGVAISPIPYLLHGTDDWQGGFARMNEGGRGELVHLPNGAQVIPHDLSVQYAKEAARTNTTMSRGGSTEVSAGHEIAAAMRQVLSEYRSGMVLDVRLNLDSREVYRNQYDAKKSLGYDIGGFAYAK